MTERTWDRAASACGVVGVVVAFAGLALEAAASGGRPPQRPNWDASTDQINAFLSRPVTGLAFVSNGLAALSFLLLTLFFAKLLLDVWRARSAPAWLTASAAVGVTVYVVLELGRVVLTSARGFAPGHHFSASEAAVMFDLSNALTTIVWGSIAMILIPAGLALIALGGPSRWLGWSAILIGLANLAYAFLPPVGASTPAELAFLAWVIVTSSLLIWRPLLIQSNAPAAVS